MYHRYSISTGHSPKVCNIPTYIFLNCCAQFEMVKILNVNIIRNPGLLLPEAHKSGLWRELGQSDTLVLKKSQNCVWAPEWISKVYQQQHTVALIACARLWISGCREHRVLGLGQYGPQGIQGAGQLENTEIVSLSIYSGSRSNLLCVLSKLQ